MTKDLSFGNGPSATPGPLSVRRWQEGDKAVLLQGCGDAEVSRWMPRMPQPYTANDASSFLRYAEIGWAEGRLAALAVVADGQVVGSVSFRVSDPDLPEVHGAYWAIPGHRGKGFITAAVRMIADWALSDLEVARYELKTDPANTASCAVARKSGFQEEGLIRCAYRRRDGQIGDLVSWSRTRK